MRNLKGLVEINGSVHFSSVQDGMCASGKAHMRSVPPLGVCLVVSADFETVEMLV